MDTPQEEMDIFEQFLGRFQSFRDWIFVIRERLFLSTVLGILIAGGLGWYQMTRPPVFTAFSTIAFSIEGDRVVNFDDAVENSLAMAFEIKMQKHNEAMNSVTFRIRAASAFEIGDRTYLMDLYSTEDDPEPNLAKILVQNVSVSRQPDSQILRITATALSPEAASMLANHVADEYIRYLDDRTGTGNRRAIAFLSQQSDELRTKIDKGEKALQAYREQESKLVSLGDDQNLVVVRLNNINSLLLRAEADLSNFEARMAQLEQAIANEGDLLEIPVISEYPTLRAMLLEVEDLEAARTLLDRKYLERHPLVIENTTKLALAKERLEVNLQRTIRELENKRGELIEGRNLLQKELAEAEKEALDLDQKAIAYNALKDELSGYRVAYDRVQTRLREIDIASQVVAPNVEFLDRAYPPEIRTSPSLLRTLLLCGALFILISVGLPLTLEFFGTRLRSLWDVETFVGTSYLGSLPKFEEGSKELLGILREETYDIAAAEVFNDIFQRINLASKIEGPRSIVVTSSRPDEGKSAISLFLGLSFAQHKKRTLLIDADFRNPSLHQVFNLVNDVGILPWYQSGKEVPSAEMLLKDPLLGFEMIEPNLWLLRTGGNARKISRMFADPRFAKLLVEFKNCFDIVLLDTPPAGLFSDVLSLADQSDELVFVSKHRSVNRRQVRHDFKGLRSCRASILGLIFNQCKDPGQFDEFHFAGSSSARAYRKYYAKRPD